MQSNRQRILTMLENGTITTDEALTLLENLGDSQVENDEVASEPKIEKPQKVDGDKLKKADKTSDQKGSGSESTESSSEPSMDEFLEDIRKDFTHVGDRFMQFMQGAVQKVKEFDFESPFGQSYTFNHTITKLAAEIDEIVIDIDNGKVTVHCDDSEEVRAEFTVKSYNSETEEAAKEAFIDKLLFVTDGNKLRVSSDMKMTKVNLDLYVPRKKYEKLSTRLMHGDFQMKNAEVGQVRVRTANGKIDVSTLIFKEAEFETANGSIDLNDVIGEKLEAETLNGRVYIDGALKEVEAQSLSGHVVVTTTNVKVEKIEAKTMSGSVEIYIPYGISLSGEIASNMGRLNLKLDDVERLVEQEQLLQRTIRFKKDTEGSTSPLYIFGEAKTGSVLVCYNAKEV